MTTNEYIKDIKRRRGEGFAYPHEAIAPNAVGWDVYKRILSHWALPPITINIEGHLFDPSKSIQFSVPDPKIDNFLSTEKITPPDVAGEEEFILEFRTACKLAKKFGDRPQKSTMQKSYNRRIKKLQKILDSLNKELTSYEPDEYAYISDILQKQVDHWRGLISKDTMQNCFPRLADNVACLNMALMAGEDVAAVYFKNFKGGHGGAKSVGAAICSIAESYLLCFGEMPTSSDDSTFMRYGRVLYEYLGRADQDGKFEDSLVKDAQAAIRKLKSKEII